MHRSAGVCRLRGAANGPSLAGRLAARIRGNKEPNVLLAFDEARRAMRADNRFYLGRKVVEVSKIIGQRGPSPGVRPWLHTCEGEHGEELPPVRLYKLGDAYFVADGNHRVSVARYQGLKMIDAEVTEFYPRLSADPGRVLAA